MLHSCILSACREYILGGAGVCEKVLKKIQHFNNIYENFFSFGAKIFYLLMPY